MEASDENAADVLFDILKVAGIAENDIAKAADGIEQVRAANELLANKVMDALKDISDIEQRPKFDGRNIIIIFAPK